MLVSDVKARVYQLIQDVSQVRWQQPEFLNWVNEGVRQIIILRPAAYPVTRNIQLVAGTRQQMPDDAVVLLDIVRNMGVSGTTPGRAVRGVDKDQIDREIPTWHSDKNTIKGGSIRAYTYDERNPSIFYCYPQVSASNLIQVEAVFSAIPPDVTADTDELEIGDLWLATLVNYVMYRFYGKDAESNGSQTMALATAYYSAFTTGIGNVTTLQTTEGAKQGRD